MERVIFWDVDTQVDFMQPHGKLYVPGAEKIVPNLKRLTTGAQEHNVLVIASACAHQEGDAEFSQFPPHCLVGTPGQKKIAETQVTNIVILPNHPVELPPDLSKFEQVILEKQQFDVFTNANTDALLTLVGGKPRVILYGVVTEICVSSAARGLQNRGYHVTVVDDAVHHLDEAKGRATLKEVTSRGGEAITTEELLEQLGRAQAA